MPDTVPAMFDVALHRGFIRRFKENWPQVDFLATAAAERLLERLEEIRLPLARIVLLGAHAAAVAPLLRAARPEAQWVVLDAVPAEGAQGACWPEALPLGSSSVDAVLLLGSLHWCNDPVGVLVQIRRALRPDGVLLAALPGARTLQELRAALLAVGLQQAVAPHVIPLMDVRDAGSLLQRAGFALPVLDTELLQASYPALIPMLRELRQMGEGNALLRRSRTPRTRGYWATVEAQYRAHCVDAEGRLPMTVELLSLTAWAPAASQPKPAARGSGTVALAEALAAVSKA